MERPLAEHADHMAAVTSVMRAQQLLLGRIEAVLKPYGLTFAAYEALRLLAFTRTGTLPMGKMGVRLMVHPASVTNVIGRLERRGLVGRGPPPTTAASSSPPSPTPAATSPRRPPWPSTSPASA